MVEDELTSEAIIQLANATNNLADAIRPSDSSWDPSGLISILTISVSIIGLAVTIYKFSTSQQQQNKDRIKSQEKHDATLLKSQQQYEEKQLQHLNEQIAIQKRFNENQELSKNLEFVKRLAHYDDTFTNITNKFGDSVGTYNECSIFAIEHLLILDRLSFLRSKEKFDDNFIQYFQRDFDLGRSFMIWLKFVSEKNSVDKNYPHFQKLISDGVVNSIIEERLDEEFYYYAKKIDTRKNPDDDSMLYKKMPTTYHSTQSDRDLIYPES